MYILRLKIGNRSMRTVLEDDDLTDEQIQQKGFARFSKTLGMHNATIRIGKGNEEVINGREIESDIPEKYSIEWTKVEEKEEEKTEEKIYELPDITNLSRKELLEQQIIAKKKSEKITDLLNDMASRELEEIEKKLVEEK